jgi:hypothetical protein
MRREIFISLLICLTKLLRRGDKAVKNVLKGINVSIGINLYLYQDEELTAFGGGTQYQVKDIFATAISPQIV